MDNTVKFAPIQIEAFALAKEIMAFLKNNRYEPDEESIERIEKLEREARKAKKGYGWDTPSTVAYFVDNRRWQEKLQQDYKEQFSKRVEAIRLTFVELEVLPADELWYTSAYMTEVRIQMVAAYIVSAAFWIDKIDLAPSTFRFGQTPGWQRL